MSTFKSPVALPSPSLSFMIDVVHGGREVLSAIEDHIDGLWEAPPITEKAFHVLGQVPLAAGKIVIDSLFLIHCPAEMGVFHGLYKAPSRAEKDPDDSLSDGQLENECLVYQNLEVASMAEKPFHDVDQAPSVGEKATIHCLRRTPGENGLVYRVAASQTAPLDCVCEAIEDPVDRLWEAPPITEKAFHGLGQVPLAAGKIVIDSLFLIHCPAEMGVFHGLYKAPSRAEKDPDDSLSDGQLENECLVYQNLEVASMAEKPFHDVDQAPSVGEKATIHCLRRTPGENGLVYRVAASQTAPLDCVCEAIEDPVDRLWEAPPITEKGFHGLGQVPSAAAKIVIIDSHFHVHCPVEMGVFDGLYKDPSRAEMDPVDSLSDSPFENGFLVDQNLDVSSMTEKAFHNLEKALWDVLLLTEKDVVHSLDEPPTATDKVLVDSLCEARSADKINPEPNSLCEAPSAAGITAHAICDTYCTAEKPLNSVQKDTSPVEKGNIDPLCENPCAAEKPDAEPPSQTERAPPDGFHEIPPSGNPNSFAARLLEGLSATYAFFVDITGRVCSAAVATFEKYLWRHLPEINKAFRYPQMDDSPESRKTPADRSREAYSAGKKALSIAICEALSAARKSNIVSMGEVCSEAIATMDGLCNVLLEIVLRIKKRFGRHFMDDSSETRKTGFDIFVDLFCKVLLRYCSRLSDGVSYNFLFKVLRSVVKIIYEAI